MIDELALSKGCLFSTERLCVERIGSQILDEEKSRLLTVKVLHLLTPAVTRSLPVEWQKITSFDDAHDWWQQMIKESSFLTITLKSSNEIIGFMFLYDDAKQKPLDMHIGYLLGELYWQGHPIKSLTI